MIPLDVVRGSNMKLKDSGPGLVAVFVGGTSGIGESTLKAFVKNTVQPRVYIVGRNNAAAQNIIMEVSKDLNPKATCHFIQADVSLLKNVDGACAKIKSMEQHVNLLFLTCGVLPLGGRKETEEGMDRKLALNYYSRYRFVFNLLPLLKAGGTSSASLARVTSVLSGGFERPITGEDLGLEKTYSVSAVGAHSCVMNDFACEQLAKEHLEVAFVHMYPGFVKTSQLNAGGFLLRSLLKIVGFLATPLALDLGESGERSLFNATASLFGPGGHGGDMVEDMAAGSDGVRGSGAYILKWDGSVVGKQEVLGPMREKGLREKVWEHTLETFARIERPK